MAVIHAAVEAALDPAEGAADVATAGRIGVASTPIAAVSVSATIRTVRRVRRRARLGSEVVDPKGPSR
jgi:hypothetical protein